MRSILVPYLLLSKMSQETRQAEEHALREQLDALRNQLARRDDDFKAVGRVVIDLQKQNRSLQMQLDARATETKHLELQLEKAVDTIRRKSASETQLIIEQDATRKMLYEKAPSLLRPVLGQERLYSPRLSSSFVRISEAAELISPRHFSVASVQADMLRSYDGVMAAKASLRLSPGAVLGSEFGGSWVNAPLQLPLMTHETSSPSIHVGRYEHALHPMQTTLRLVPKSQGTPRASALTSAVLAEAADYTAASRRSVDARAEHASNGHPTDRATSGTGASGSCFGSSPSTSTCCRSDLSATRSVSPRGSPRACSDPLSVHVSSSPRASDPLSRTLAMIHRVRATH